MAISSMLLIVSTILLLLPRRASAFGAGNVPSVALIEGINWRHGDIEDILLTIAFLHGKKWTTMMVKRTYFGNWLRDYSQALDVGSLKGLSAPTIRVLVWILSFMSFGYATDEFEVTDERLGVYRPEEHIDNPKGYADGLDARSFDPRLRGLVEPIETEIDTRTGMKNYIAAEHGHWSTSAAYLRFSIARSMHYGRQYLHGARSVAGKESDLCEALRCLGQALHCLEDFSAHSNYIELALRELGHVGVFPHCGSATEISVHGRRVFPLVTGTFGGVDFLHSVLGELSDHLSQNEVSEVDVLNNALKNAQGASGVRGSNEFLSVLSKVPGGHGYASEARDLAARSATQQEENTQRNSTGPGQDAKLDPVKIASQIYPILHFRDKIVRAISTVIEKIPGLEKLIQKINETITAFVLGLLAPFLTPVIDQITRNLKSGSSGVMNASAQAQYEPWNDPTCTDPTHSMLSKDHFTCILNPCAGRVAATILQYAVPRIIYAWEHPGVGSDEVANDILRVLHHPALRDEQVEVQRNMFNTVTSWVEEGNNRTLIPLLSADSVRNGKNQVVHGNGQRDGCGHGQVKGSLWAKANTTPTGSSSGYGSSRPPSPYYSPVPPAGLRPPTAAHHGSSGQPPPFHQTFQPPTQSFTAYPPANASANSPAQYPPAQYPPAQYPPAQYPPAPYPLAQYAHPQRLSPQYPSAQYPSQPYNPQDQLNELPHQVQHHGHHPPGNHGHHRQPHDDNSQW